MNDNNDNHNHYHHHINDDINIIINTDNHHVNNATQLRSTGTALRYASEELRGDWEVVAEAMLYYSIV